MDSTSNQPGLNQVPPPRRGKDTTLTINQSAHHEKTTRVYLAI